jgi:16S rRNA (guanine527-N7)-methyltransferase
LTELADPLQSPLRLPLLDVAASLQLEISDSQTDALLAYLALLQRWNATYNLTSIRDAQGMLIQHVADCLAAIDPLNRHFAALRTSNARLLDVGSGGGLPGVVIAVMCPSISVVCVDTVGKKAAFIRQVAAELKLRNLTGEHARVEALKLAPFDLITSRAFASLPDFVGLTRGLLTPQACWMAMKGKVPDAEIAELPAHVEVFHVEHLTVPKLNADRCLVWMKPTGSRAQ